MNSLNRKINVFDDRTIEITQSGQERENRLKIKVNRDSGNYGTLTKDLTIHVISVLGEEKEDRG